jgi:lactate dehydrogenase-like 2-hydroxyacid dehydrogenase
VVRIAVSRALPEAGLAELRQAGEVWVNMEPRMLRPEELQEAARGAAALVTMPVDRVDDALLDAAGPQLQIVANYAVGYDNIDVEACRRRGVAATNTPDTLVETTADLAFALILAACRRVTEADRLMRARTPWTWTWDFMLGHDVHGSTLGIVGLGAIGRAVARRARGFDMRVVYSGRRDAPADVERALDARRLPLGELLTVSDVVSIHVPLSPETHHLIDADALARMKPTAFLVNTARGPIVDEAALADALARGTIAGAGLDVFEREPAVHPGILACENVVLMPHLGSATWATRERMALRAVRNVTAVLRGEPAPDDLTRRA